MYFIQDFERKGCLGSRIVVLSAGFQVQTLLQEQILMYLVQVDN
ncbi:hypothetical protein J2T20_005229 [Paenibacillus wynnii]|nr:hypothetical protein [Paenibacillus wynnii]